MWALTMGGVSEGQGWEEWRPRARRNAPARRDDAPARRDDAGARPPDARTVGSVAPLPVSPFTRLSRVHALVMGGDAAVAVALAGSLFFSISPEAARTQVARYLLLTMAPFAVISPLIGPAIDRVAG